LVEARLKRFTEAIADYTKAIELNTDPRNEDIFFWRGNAEMEIKNFDGAISDYAKVTKSNPNFELAYTNLIAAKEALHAVKK
jgi:tetratricopeptide (TPR) repeat protein